MALYRKYRPGSFGELLGQEQVTVPLSRALDNGRINHAYLFSGPRGCGKTSSARIMARSLNCEQGPTSTPCGVCNSCIALAPNGPGNLDVTELDAASHNSVDDMRELRDRAMFAPAESRYRIFIIDEAHMVTRQGSNALLKIVEEPPAHLIFIFATTEPEKVIGTIRSRTHHYPFRLLTPQAMRQLLERTVAAEGIHVEDSVYPLVIRAGGGSPRDTLSVLDQLFAGTDASGLTYDHARLVLGATDDALLDAAIDALSAADRAALFTTVDRVIEAGLSPRRFAEDLLERLRDLLVLQAVPQAIDAGLVDAPTDRAATLLAEAAAFDQRSLPRIAGILNEGLFSIKGATSPRLLLEILCAKMLVDAAPSTSTPVLQTAPPKYERKSVREARLKAEAEQQRLAAEQAAAAQPVAPAPAPAPTVPQEPMTHPAHSAAAPQPVAAEQAPTAAVAPTPAQTAVPVEQPTPAPMPAASQPQVSHPTPEQQPVSAPATPPAAPAPAPTQPAPAPTEQQPAPVAPQPEQHPHPTHAITDPEQQYQEIRAQWLKIRKDAAKQNQVLGILLTEAYPMGVRDGAVILGHHTGALAQRLNAESHSKVLVELVHKHTGITLDVRCEVAVDPKALGFSHPEPVDPEIWRPELPREPEPSSVVKLDDAPSQSSPPQDSTWGQPARLGDQEPATDTSSAPTAATPVLEQPAPQPSESSTTPAPPTAAPQTADETGRPRRSWRDRLNGADSAVEPSPAWDDAPPPPEPEDHMPPEPPESVIDEEAEMLEQAAVEEGMRDHRSALEFAMDLVTNELGGQPI
ncbi:DNA polymerase III subunit gamma and tau [Corynebacterium sp. HS2168-gen11]|uniref:DNA polymerase III subunit gamma and tau n=1 Tax=Corynebacterium sp. HS2168-gen11 TaxID=2974027 RepID=UPI00216ABC4C|nr:DNA polymerase III subunit gamma and tau [Corynebacterium sp. HS2168-gen11]MCS4535566.1 DNA polymerase III subunit gamma and tau [Corynebacterium sp. HS2168-gen11]